MNIRTGLKAALLATTLIGLSACGSSEPIDPAVFDAEVQRLVDDGDMYGQVFMALKDNRPTLYADFRKVALKEYGRGRTAREAGFLASKRMREKFLTEVIQMSRSASDEQVKDILSVLIDTLSHLNEEDPKICVSSIKGEQLEKAPDVPSEIRKRETQLIVDLLEAPKTAANRRAASLNEVTNWMVNLSSLEPSVARMMELVSLDRDLKKGESGELCEGMITAYKRLSYKTPDKRGALFRGMALMTLQQQLIDRNTSEEAGS